MKSEEEVRRAIDQYADMVTRRLPARLRDGLTAEVCEPVPEGDKFALRPIEAGDPVIKFGGRIGTATQPIPRGAYVHLHNMKSDFDDYAATLDVETALDNQIVYHLEQEDMDR